MAEFAFPFSAETGGFVYPVDPNEYAARLWEFRLIQDEAIPLDVGCELAPYDLEIWEALRAGVNAGAVQLETMPGGTLRALCCALAAPKPRKGVGETKRQYAHLFAIMAGLTQHYKLSTNKGAKVLARLHGVPSAQSIRVNVLYNFEP
jgi:hypothetical protein